MELLWQNGQVVVQSQNHRQFRKPPPPTTNTGDRVIPERGIRSSDAEHYNINQHLFMQEDEMASWLFDSMNEDPPFSRHDFSAGTLFHPPTVTGDQKYGGVVQSNGRESEPLQQPRPAAAPRPPIPPSKKPEQATCRKQNFGHFSTRSNAGSEPGASSSSMIAAAQESTVVDSCDTPFMAAKTYVASTLSETARSTAETGFVSMSSAGKAETSAGGRETTTVDMTVTSSLGGSSESAEPVQKEAVLDRKRKGREPDESEFQSEVSKKAFSYRYAVFFFRFFCLGYRAQGSDVDLCEKSTYIKFSVDL